VKEAPLPPDQDPKVLNKKINNLERDLVMMKELVGLLKELPANREDEKREGGKAGKKKKAQLAGAEGGKDPEGGKLPGLTAPYRPAAGGE
jgi:hypothetical protein